jgi:transglutaminase-like putative cysteine protease
MFAGFENRPPYLDAALRNEPMTILNVRHTTVYRYRRPVRLGDQRLMLRPRDSHDLRLITAAIGAGTTHAWADIYLPGAGWIAYDPTNGTVNGGNLIRVAVTRDISQAVPVGGSFVGARGDYLGMTVDVAVISERRAEASSA